MRTRDSVVTAAASLPTECAQRGINPPIQLVAPSGVLHAWLVVPREDDAVYADEYGGLWWAKACGSRAARAVRRVWPEEMRSLADAIDDGVRVVLNT